MTVDYQQAIRERAYEIWNAEGRIFGKDIDHWLRAEAELTRVCSYCFGKKLIPEFSYEHIWPDALGGDHLPSLWQTRNICERCNNLSGLFVDGEFIKSWFIMNERTAGAMEFLDPAAPERSRLPPNYIGKMDHPELQLEETAEVWLGPCGAHMVHIRPKNEPLWNTYAGGKPSRKRRDWGSAYLALTSTNHFWIIASLCSFHNHFRRTERIVMNSVPPQGLSPPFTEIDLQDIDQTRQIRIAKSFGDAASKNEQVKLHFELKTDVGSRLLVKVALGLGRELLGEQFLGTSYAATLRRALWERDPNARRTLPVRGSGYLSEAIPIPAANLISWPNAWTLILWKIAPGLALIVTTPNSKVMTVLISDDLKLLGSLGGRYSEAEVYLTIPALGFALNTPITLPQLIAHQTKVVFIPELANLKIKRRDPTSLPPCR
jgi:hypothetical protein